MTGQDTRPGPAGAVGIGSLIGVGIYVRPGLFVMGAVLTVLFGQRFDRGGVDQPYLIATILVLSIYLSVLLHELAHVAVARYYRMPVDSVTLHLLGGETVIQGESRTPRQEFLTSGVGPLASVAIGGVGLGVSLLLADGTASTITWAIGWINLIVAAFNLLPGLPLDGGRVLRAVIWAVTGREDTGIVVAAWIGRVAAVTALGAGILLVMRGSRAAWLDLAIAAIIAIFLWQGATQALRFGRRAQRINELDARRLAVVTDAPTGDLPRLPADLQGSALLRAITLRPAPSYLLVDAEGTPAGVLHSDAVAKAYRQGVE